MRTTQNSDDRIMVGIDLHGNNAVCGLVERNGKRLKEKRLPCDLGKIVDWLSPLGDRIDTVAVESTFNWYWLVDGLTDSGFKVVLANPAKIERGSVPGFRYFFRNQSMFSLRDGLTTLNFIHKYWCALLGPLI